MRSHGWRALNHHESPEPALHTWAQALATASQRTAAHVSTNAAVRIESVKGRDTLTRTGLDTLEEPPSLLQLRAAVFARLPRVDLPEVLLEIHARTGLAQACPHLSAGAARGGIGPSVGAPCCSPKPVLSDSNRWSAPMSPP